MPSSIFGSDTPAVRRAVPWLVAACLGTGLVLEAATRLLVPVVNASQRRSIGEYRAALRLARKPGLQTVLFVGNSLTYTDVDVSRVQAALGSGYEVTRWAVDDTNYLDWYYGLRRVFAAGGRPAVVVVGGIGSHFLAPQVRGRYFAHYMLAWDDVLDAARRTKTDRTETAALAVANLSAFYGSREEINKQMLATLMPSFPALAARLSEPARPPDLSGNPAPIEMMRSRLSDLDALCRRYDARAVVWLAPLPGQDRYAPAMVRAGANAGVAVIDGSTFGRVKPEAFSDGLHLGEAATAPFSDALGASLAGILKRQDPM